MDRIKLVSALVLVAAGITGFYYYADQALLYRVLGLLAIMGVAIALAVSTQLGMTTVNYGRGAVLEARKSVWPTRRETTQTTLIVIVMVIIIGLLLWLFDTLLLWAVELLTRKGS